MPIFRLPENSTARQQGESSLGVAGIGSVHAFGQQPFAAALSPTSQGRTPTLAFHTRTKSVLAFASSF